MPVPFRSNCQDSESTFRTYRRITYTSSRSGIWLDWYSTRYGHCSHGLSVYHTICKCIELSFHIVNRASSWHSHPLIDPIIFQMYNCISSDMRQMDTMDHCHGNRNSNHFHKSTQNSNPTINHMNMNPSILAWIALMRVEDSHSHIV